jgi:hypothetical protein
MSQSHFGSGVAITFHKIPTYLIGENNLKARFLETEIKKARPREKGENGMRRLACF